MKNISSLVIRTLRNDLVEFVNSNNYGITQEIFNNVQGIISALDSLKIDNILKSNSSQWRKQSDTNSIQQDQSCNFIYILSFPKTLNVKFKEALNFLTKINTKCFHLKAMNNLLDQGTIMIREIMMSLDKRTLSTLQENEIRKAYFVSTEKLNAFLKKIHPFSYGAYTRLNNYAMTVGLNDRYANVRNELSNKNPPNNLNTFTQWANKTNPSKPGLKTPDWKDYTYGLSHSDLNRYENGASSTNKNEAGFHYTDSTKYISSPMRQLSSVMTMRENSSLNQNRFTSSAKSDHRSEDWKKDATEAGTNLNFPSISEQKYRYSKPVKENYLNFVINPQLNIGLLGRPFSEAIIEPIGTEYQSRFKHANANPIDKFPWIK